MSGWTVVVATRDLNVVQQVELPPHDREHDVRCLCWSGAGKLAVCSAKGVYVYHQQQQQPQQQPQDGSAEDVHLELLAFVPCAAGGALVCCWRQQREALLVASGTSLELFQVTLLRKDGQCAASLVSLWTLPLVTPPLHMAYSPDDKYLALCGAHDRLVKVLYFAAPADRWDPAKALDSPPNQFTYLPHPRGVQSLSWRQGPMSSERVKNVLLTQARDDVTRLWIEVLRQEEPGHGVFADFVIANVVDVAPGTLVTWLRVRDVPRALQAAAAAAADPAKPRHLVVTEDWIVGVEGDGAVVVWGVLNLSSSDKGPQKFPTVFIWNRLPSLPSQERTPLKIIALGHANVLDDQRGPSRLNLYTATRKGGISAWRYNLRTPGRITRHLVGSIWGHKGKISSSVPSRSAPLVFTVDSYGHGVVWECAPSTMVDPSVVLSEVVELKRVRAACWLAAKPGQALLAVFSDEPPSLEFHTLAKHRDAYEQGSSSNKVACPRASIVKLVALADDPHALLDDVVLVALTSSGELVLLTASRKRGFADLKEVPVAVGGGAATAYTCLCPATPLFDEALPYHLLTGSDKGEVAALWLVPLNSSSPPRPPPGLLLDSVSVCCAWRGAPARCHHCG